MKRYLRVPVTVAINIIVFVVLLEFGGVIYYAATTGAFFYTRQVPREAERRAANPFLAEYRPVFHPYFGYVMRDRPGVAQQQEFYLNNHNFLQLRAYVLAHPGCCDLPVRDQKPGEFVVGIFGGSVAAAVAMAAQNEDRLAQLLARAPKFAGRNVVVLNFAVGGYK